MLSKINILQKRIALHLFLLYFTRYTSAYLCVWGVSVLIGRLLFETPAYTFIYGAWGVSASLIAALITTYNKCPSQYVLRVFMDEHNHCGGLLIVEENDALGKWSEKVKKLTLPHVTQRKIHHFLVFCVTLLFLIASSTIPIPKHLNSVQQHLDISREHHALKEKVNALEEARIVDEKVKNELLQNLENIKKTTDAMKPADSLEALDYTEAKIESEAKKALAKSTKAADVLQSMKSLVETTEKASQKENTTLTPEAMKEFSELAKMAGITNMPGVANAMSNMFSSSVLKTADAASLQKALDGKLLQELKKLRTLQKAGVLSSNQCAKCMSMCQNGGNKSGEKKGASQSMNQANKQLQAFLQQNDAKMLSSLLVPTRLIKCNVQMGGIPAVGRGPGHVPLVLGTPSQDNAAGYKARTISSRAFNAKKESIVYKIEKGIPTVENGEAGTHGALNNSGGVAKQTGHSVLPRHRTAVKSFFDK